MSEAADGIGRPTTPRFVVFARIRLRPFRLTVLPGADEDQGQPDQVRRRPGPVVAPVSYEFRSLPGIRDGIATAVIVSAVTFELASWRQLAGPMNLALDRKRKFPDERRRCGRKFVPPGLIAGAETDIQARERFAFPLSSHRNECPR